MARSSTPPSMTSPSSPLRSSSQGPPRESSPTGSNGPLTPFGRPTEQVPEAEWNQWLREYQLGNYIGDSDEWQQFRDRVDARPSVSSTSSLELSDSDLKVSDQDGSFLTSREFYLKHNYLAAPPADRQVRALRQQAMVRHGLHLSQRNPILGRYCELAQQALKVDLCTIMLLDNSDPEQVQKGDQNGVTLLGFTRHARDTQEHVGTSVPARTTVCSHASLMGSDQFVILDRKKDWRFANLALSNNCFEPEDRFEFYASAALSVRCPRAYRIENCSRGPDPEQLLAEDASEDRIYIARFAVLSHDARKDFPAEERLILDQIARLASEALNREWQAKLLASTYKMTVQLENLRSDIQTLDEGILIKAAQREILHLRTSRPVESHLPAYARLVCKTLLNTLEADGALAFAFNPAKSVFDASITSPLEGSDSSASSDTKLQDGMVQMILHLTEDNTRKDVEDIPDLRPFFRQWLTIQSSGEPKPRALTARTWNVWDEDCEDNEVLRAAVPSQTQALLACPAPVSDDDASWIVPFVYFKQPVFFESPIINFCQDCAGLIREALAHHALARARKNQEAFVRQVSHELRTPLHGILGLAEEIRTSTKKSRDLLKATSNETSWLLDGIADAALQLSHVFEDIVAFAGETASTRTAAPEDVLQLIERGVIEEGSVSQRRIDQLRGRSTKDTIILLCGRALLQKKPTRYFFQQPERIKRVLSYVVNNAIKFGRHDAASDCASIVSVQLLSPSQNLIPVVVQDRGIGMSNAFLQGGYLEPFRKENPFSDGLGLGMSLAVGLLDEMGGHLKAYSEAEKGTTVSLFLPVQADSGELGARDPYPIPNAVTASIRIFLHATYETCPPALKDCIGRSVFELLSKAAFVSSAKFADLIVAVDPVTSGQRSNVELQIRSEFPLTALVVLECGRTGQQLVEKENGPTLRLATPFGPTACLSMLNFACSVHEQSIGSVAMSLSRGLSFDTASSATVPDSRTQSSDGCSLPSPPFSILVVEDNPINMKLLCSAAKSLQCEILTAENGLEAVQLFRGRQHPPSVICLDISLPIMDGFEACARIRAEEKLGSPSPRIIAISALSSEADQERGLAGGMDEWRIKPTKLAQLREDLQFWKTEWEANRSMRIHRAVQ